MLQCLGVTEDRACSFGTYSEGGWAIASALGAIVVKPDCALAAFKDPAAAQCLKKVPLPMTISLDQQNWHAYEEAKR